MAHPIERIYYLYFYVGIGSISCITWNYCLSSLFFIKIHLTTNPQISSSNSAYPFALPQYLLTQNDDDELVENKHRFRSIANKEELRIYNNLPIRDVKITDSRIRLANSDSGIRLANTDRGMRLTFDYRSFSIYKISFCMLVI